MQLKRGLERNSCDFCYGRKIKCDRSARMKERHDKCSQCTARQIMCRLDSSDDVRIRRRRRESTDRGGEGRDSSARSPEEQQLPSNNSSHQTTRRTPSPSLVGVATSTISIVSLPLLSPNVLDSVPPLSLNFPSPMPSTEVDATHFSIDQTNQFQHPNSFDLSADGVSFLDHIFMESDQQPELDFEPSTSRIATIGLSVDDARERVWNHLLDASVTTSVNEGQNQDSSLMEDLSANTFDAALHAYFDVAAHGLPILFEDAFWLDYHAGRCSPALAFAVASRGMPFITAGDKWSLQQQTARHFREAFLKAQQTVDSQKSVRLDELEALALMVDFEYDNTHSSTLESRLGDLFLTHDCLVLMTLQARIESYDQDSGMLLARATERCSLLFWHIYGLDAFHSLNRKSMSRIQDNHSELVDPLSPHSTGSYLDAILALAMIAREILSTFCSPKSKRQGVSLNDVEPLYEKMHHWRNHSCPSYLQWPGGNSSQPESKNGYQRASHARVRSHTELQRAVVGLLELNCYMQMEDCITQHGIQELETLEGEILGLRIEYETLRAINNVTSPSQSTLLVLNCGDETTLPSLADMSPQILRNICAGVCMWLCRRVQAMQRQSSSSQSPLSKSVGQRKKEDGREPLILGRVAGYAAKAKLLRDIAASAISHKDTSQLIAGLDTQLDLLGVSTDGTKV